MSEPIHPIPFALTFLETVSTEPQPELRYLDETEGMAVVGGVDAAKMKWSKMTFTSLEGLGGDVDGSWDW